MLPSPKLKTCWKSHSPKLFSGYSRLLIALLFSCCKKTFGKSVQHQIPSHSVRGERKSGGLHYSFDLDLAALLHWGLELKKTSTHTLSLINSAFNCADSGARNGFYWQWSVPLHLTAGPPREMAQGREREQKKRVQYFPPPAQPITRSSFRTSSNENGRDRLPCLPVIEATDTLLLSPWRPAAPTVELNPVCSIKKGLQTGAGSETIANCALAPRKRDVLFFQRGVFCFLVCCLSSAKRLPLHYSRSWAGGKERRGGRKIERKQTRNGEMIVIYLFIWKAIWSARESYSCSKWKDRREGRV